MPISRIPGFVRCWGILKKILQIKKVISAMYLALGDAARSSSWTNTEPRPWELRAEQLIALCNECSRKKRNRTLDRHKFFSRLQQPGESLSQFWHALNGLAALCDFGDITTILVLDMFIIHMSNKKVQEKLCTEPKEPDLALEFAIAFEEGARGKRHTEHKCPKQQKQW